jgi:hypothetical protein
VLVTRPFLFRSASVSSTAINRLPSLTSAFVQAPPSESTLQRAQR